MILRAVVRYTTCASPATLQPMNAIQVTRSGEIRSHYAVRQIRLPITSITRGCHSGSTFDPLEIQVCSRRTAAWSNVGLTAYSCTALHFSSHRQQCEVVCLHSKLQGYRRSPTVVVVRIQTPGRLAGERADLIPLFSASHKPHHPLIIPTQQTPRVTTRSETSLTLYWTPKA